MEHLLHVGLDSKIFASDAKEHIAMYSHPAVIVNEANVVVFANQVFYNQLLYSQAETENILSVNDLVVTSSNKGLGLIDLENYILPAGVNLSDFITLKDKKGVLRYFFFKSTDLEKNYKVLYFYDHFNVFNQLTNTINSNISYENIFKSFPGIVFVFDHNFVVIDVNTDADTMLFDESIRIKGQRFQDLKLPNVLKETALIQMKESLRLMEQVSFEYELPFDNQLQQFNCKLIPLEKFIIALIRDITQEKRKIELLTEKEKNMTDMFNDMPVAVVQLSQCGNILFSNSPFKDLLSGAGLKVPENIYSIIDHQIIKEVLTNVISHKTHCALLGSMYVDIASKYRMVNGEKQYILTLIDATDREMNKMALEKSEVNYKMLVDTSPNGIIIRDFENVYYANKVALSILGCKTKEEINFEKMMDPCSVKKIEGRLRKVETGEKVNFLEIELKKLNNGEKVAIETKPVWINYKGKSAFQIVFRNISVEKLLMEEKVKKRLLEENNRKLMEEIAYRIEIEDELKYMIDKNKVLLNEVHHRVKNNYQVVSSMLNRCLLKVSDTASIKAIMASKSRLVSMAIVGDFCHDAQNFNAISLIDFLKKIFSHFIRENGSGWSNERIKFTTYIRKLVVNIAQATTIGLIFNEILSLLLQLSEKFNDNYCTFVSLKWQNRKEIVFTVKFDYNITSEIEKSLDSTDEIVFIREMLEQVDGLLVCHCKNAELNLIIKLTKIS